MLESHLENNRLRIKGESWNYREGLRGVSMFFQGRDEVHKTMRRLAKRLEKANISYAVIAGMAVFAHRHRRTTNDVDILLTPEGFAEYQRVFVPKFYAKMPKRPRRFVDRANDVTIDVLVTGLFPGSGKPGPISYPNPREVSQTIDKIRVLNLLTLIQLKLAARRYQDFADVVNLIRSNNLEESFTTHLHPSVRGDYIECLEEKRREEEYEAREG
jgi:hypothetical protein